MMERSGLWSARGGKPSWRDATSPARRRSDVWSRGLRFRSELASRHLPLRTMFRRSRRNLASQRIERFEGRWQPEPMSPYPKVFGKIEWDAFASGDSEIELFAQIVDIPDGSEVVLRWGDV